MVVTAVLQLLFWNVILCRSIMRGTCALTYEMRSVMRGTCILNYEMRSLLFWYIMLCNNPEEQRPYQHCSRSLRSHNLQCHLPEDSCLLYSFYTTCYLLEKYSKCLPFLCEILIKYGISRLTNVIQISL